MILRNSQYASFLTKLAQEPDRQILRSPGLYEGTAAATRALGISGFSKSLAGLIGGYGATMGAGAGLGALAAKAIGKKSILGAAVGAGVAAVPSHIIGNRLSRFLEKRDLNKKGIFRVSSGSARFPLHVFTPEAYEKYVQTEKKASSWSNTLHKLAFSAGLGRLGGRAAMGALRGGGAIPKALWKHPKAAFGTMALGMPIAGGVEGFQKARMLRGQQRLASKFRLPYEQQHFR